MTDWNYTIAVAGMPGTGKSTLSLKRIRELQREGRAYAFVYEGDGQFPRTGADRRRLACVRDHRSLGDLQAYLGDERGHVPEAEIHIVRLYPGDVDSWRGQPLDSAGLALVAVAERVSQKSGRRCVVWYDEIAAVKGATSSAPIDERLRAALGARRHLGIAFGYTTQSVAWAHRDLRRLTNERHVFRVDDGEDLRALRDFKVPEQDLPTIENLSNFHYMSY